VRSSLHRHYYIKYHDSIYPLELTSDEYLWLTNLKWLRTRLMTKMTTYRTQRNQPWVVLHGLAATIA